MKKKIIFLLGFAGLVLLSGCSTIRKSPNFEKRAPEIRTIAILPPSVAIQKINFKGMDEILYQQSENAAKQMAQNLSLQLTSRGYEVKILGVDGEMLEKHPELKEEVSKLKDRYASLLEDVQKNYVNKMKWKDFKLSLGSDVNPVVDALNADVLIFSSAAGFVKSKGQISSDVAKTVLIGVASLGHVMYIQPTTGGQIFVSVVDGDNGEILWHNFSNPAVKTDLTDEGKIQGLVRAVVNRYPQCIQKEIQSAPAIKEVSESQAGPGAPLAPSAVVPKV